MDSSRSVNFAYVNGVCPERDVQLYELVIIFLRYDKYD